MIDLYEIFCFLFQSLSVEHLQYPFFTDYFLLILDYC